MGSLLYKALLLKELFYGLIIKGIAGLIVYIEAGHIPKNWFYLAAIIILIFPFGTVLIQKAKQFFRNASGFILFGLSLFKMLFIPALIIVFFDNESEHSHAYIMPSLIAYIILLLSDTYWKIKWLFGKKF
jgi:hypothetical protein